MQKLEKGIHILITTLCPVHRYAAKRWDKYHWDCNLGSINLKYNLSNSEQCFLTRSVFSTALYSSVSQIINKQPYALTHDLHTDEHTRNIIGKKYQQNFSNYTLLYRYVGRYYKHYFSGRKFIQVAHTWLHWLIQEKVFHSQKRFHHVCVCVAINQAEYTQKSLKLFSKEPFRKKDFLLGILSIYVHLKKSDLSCCLLFCTQKIDR